MEKCGILTFHRADNIGAVLQAYALNKYLTDNIGVESEIIDYKCLQVEKTRYVQTNNLITKIPLCVYYMIKRKGFENFRNKWLALSQKKYTMEDIACCNSMYSTFITGSDQVWNIECSGNDSSFFLDFVESDKIKIAYGASAGSINFTELEIASITEYLKDFKGISVREASLIKRLKLGSDTCVLPDPVFLLDKVQWHNVTTKKIRKRKYVFCYLIQEDVNVLNAAKEYAKEHKCDIVTNKSSLHFILNNSPDSFLGWIDGAEAVFTNSFHGTAFSIIFKKNLAADIALKNGEINNRIQELLYSAGLQECIITDENKLPVRVQADEWVEEQRKKAYHFLARFLKK